MNSTSHPLPRRGFGSALAGLVAPLLMYMPVHAQNLCETHASLVNPAVAASSRNEVIAGKTGGIGGTGAPRDAARGGALAGRPGIGGTGISNGTNGTNGGIGGTGIVGMITGFASVCVNGLEVQYDASTPVVSDGRGATARELAVGQVVAVRASGAGAQLFARNIAVIHAVVGPVSRVDASTGQLELLGQQVRASNPTDLANLKTGDWVQVSGHRLSSGEIAASRVEPLPAQAQAQITGQISQLDAAGFSLYGGRVSLDALRLPAGAVPGAEVAVRGRWDGISLHAQELAMGPTRQSVGRVDSVVIEGYVHGLRGRELSVGNEVMTLAPDVQISGSGAIEVDQRVQLTGRVGADQRITVERVELKGGGSGPDGARSGKASSSGSSSGKGSSGSSGSSSGKGSSGSSGSSSGKGSSGSSGSSSGKGSSGGDDGSGSSGSSGSGSSSSSGSDSSGSGSSGGGSSGSGSGSGSGSSGSSGGGSSGGSGGGGGGGGGGKK